MATKSKQVKKEKVKIPPFKIENARLIYRNFEGKGKKFNAAGLRNFHVVLPVEVAQVLEQDGWNVKWEDPKEEGDLPWAHIKVAVRFENYPPRIIQITSRGNVLLDENSVSVLDWAEIETADLMLSGSVWDVDGKHGIKAYLKKMYVTLVEDDLDRKYGSMNSSRVVEEDED